MEKSFTIKEIEQMAKDLTVTRPQFGDRAHNSALQTMVERAKLLATKEQAEKDLEENNVIAIDKNKPKGGK